MAAPVAVGQAPPSADDGATALEARGLTVHFGGVHAIDGVDLTLTKGEILGLIGPNGAGKTTLVNALSGFQRPTAGRILVGGMDVTGWSPHRLARLGLARTFQSVRMFPDLTVLENVELGGVGTGMRRSAARKWARDLLERMKLDGMSHMYGAGLPHGLERRFGIVRALATKPSLPAPRRAGRRPERTGERRARRGADADPGRLLVRADGDRARHASDHAALRAHPGARLRQDDQHRDPGRGSKRSCGPDRLPRQEGDRC